MPSLSLGFSPCPNDTFVFYAITHGKVDSGGLCFHEVLHDVETLNRMAVRSELDITKTSYHAFGHLRDQYCLLRAGGAIGRGCGPLVISKKERSMSSLRGKRIAIPGRMTTAYLLLQLYDRSFALPSPDIVEMPFHTIIQSVARDEVEAGLIIHESRFTYPSYGLHKVIDLGAWWEKVTGAPIPLGGIIAKQSTGEATNRKINDIIKESVTYAFSHRQEPLPYIKKHAQELSEEVINQHIDLYVNDFTLDAGPEGERAVIELITRSEDAGIIPKSGLPVFMTG